MDRIRFAKRRAAAIIEQNAGTFSDKFWQTSSAQILDRLLTNPIVVNLIQTRGYHPDFVAYCTSRIATLKRLGSETPGPKTDTPAQLGAAGDAR
jgi:hypothetical protein